MIFALLAVVGALPSSNVVDVGTDDFATGCAGIEMRAGRNRLTVECRRIEGGVELEIDDGDINAIALRTKRWPKRIRFVMKAWMFESMSVSVTTTSKEKTSLNVTGGDCKNAVIRCGGRTTKKLGERRVSETITIPETEVTIVFDVDGEALAPGASLRVHWIDAFRH